jgi:hypothetical protein
MCEALESTREDLAFTAFERLFAERGLPNAIRSDSPAGRSRTAATNACMHEGVETALLLQAVHAGRACGFLLQGQVRRSP